MLHAYLPFIEQHAKALRQAGWFQAAANLARLLDSHTLSFPPGQRRPTDEDKERGQCRGEILLDLLAICRDAGIQIPGDDIYLVQQVGIDYLHSPGRELPSRSPELKGEDSLVKLFAHLDAALEGQAGAAAWRARALADLLLTTSKSTRWDGIGVATILAAINVELAEIGSPLFQPLGEHDLRKIGAAANQGCTVEACSVLVVDDLISELVRTARAIVAWPNFVISLLHQQMNTASREDTLPAVGRAILELEPDIVLMDQAMRATSGDAVVQWLQHNGGAQIVFVANSGGGGGELHDVGALQNCNKGNDLRGLQQAVQLIEQKRRVI